ncbi:MAG: 1-(5-phosphoribosyl)-5-[(5-phosphoribosylamino)methylideneamino] imidazole-4-carboxamide isomerase [Fervidicoccaceae archaeon]
MIPSIDLSRGIAVKRVRGEPGTGLSLGDPVALALRWAEAGAERLHVVDLDGAHEGRPLHLDVVSRIAAASRIPIQYGGGLRSVEDCLKAREAGAAYLVLGTGAATSRLVDVVVEEIGASSLIVALDVRGGKLAVDGWRRDISKSPDELIDELDGLGLHAFLVTCVDVEGSLRGPCLDLVRGLVRRASTPIFYAGGVSSLEDLIELGRAGVAGVILGMALYAGKFSLQEAKRVAEKVITS